MVMSAYIAQLSLQIGELLSELKISVISHLLLQWSNWIVLQIHSE